MSFKNFVLLERLCLLKDSFSNTLGSWATVGHVVFDSEIVVGATRIMAGSEQNPTIGLVLSDHVGSGWSGENAVLSNDELGHAVGCSDLEDSLYSLVVVITSITANDYGLALGSYGIKNCLYKVFCIVLPK